MKRFVFLTALAALLGGVRLPAQDTPAQITFCSYNVKNWLTMDRAGGQPAGKPEKEMAAVIRFLTEIKPDILGLCEIGTEDDLKLLQAKLKEAGIDLPHHELAHGGDATRRLGLLSRFPITARNSQTDLRYLIGEQVFPVQRGFLDATVEFRKGFELRCIGVHLKSKREIAEADQMLMRRNEAHLLRKHTDSILKADPATKLVVYGDFNEHKAEAPIVEIEGVSGTDTSLHRINLKDTRGETWTHFWEFMDVYSRLDYFFVSRPLEGYVDKRASHIFDPEDFMDGSDHRPLVLKIDLVKDAPK